MRTSEPKLRAKVVLPERVAKAIEEILGYLWEAELGDFIADGRGPDEGHIFCALAVLDGWFHGHGATPDELVADFYSAGSKGFAKAREAGSRGP